MTKQTVKLFRLKDESNRQMEKEVEEITGELKEFFGINWVENLPKIILLDSRELIDKVRGRKTEKWEVGWSEYRTVYLLDQDKFETESNHGKKSDEEYRALIKHELAHSFYAIKSGRNNNPRWLNEGVCIYISGQLKFKSNISTFKNFLDFYNKEGAEIYTESGWVVYLLVEKFGKDRLMQLLDEIKAKSPDEEGFKEIFSQVYGMELSYENLNHLLTERGSGIT